MEVVSPIDALVLRDTPFHSPGSLQKSIDFHGAQEPPRGGREQKQLPIDSKCSPISAHFWDRKDVRVNDSGVYVISPDESLPEYPYVKSASFSKRVTPFKPLHFDSPEDRSPPRRKRSIDVISACSSVGSLTEIVNRLEKQDMDGDELQSEFGWRLRSPAMDRYDDPLAKTLIRSFCDDADEIPNTPSYGVDRFIGFRSFVTDSEEDENNPQQEVSEYDSSEDSDLSSEICRPTKFRRSLSDDSSSEVVRVPARRPTPMC
mmetsp:Transcript_9512/g.15567  ORF Transcript_9512/g.15567 Transcript_9512/m.15567 type:complete len:260 (+) Transcript_9512:201-980(+)|eukprot:CAMPEP_0184664738 /NCGR_PEP_ID=MMETSP0308-20130426/54192_1 /TAXON_ID=38269 /ORGANISM="Gloeochaete witrockiana, Strain SAG 46.84" /LENGTH=259 /DNA_ID=CAMNT_0027108323 /DNA_START=102 /DNA_END=881 /DNA_ORIENTATION=+